MSVTSTYLHLPTLSTVHLCPPLSTLLHLLGTVGYNLLKGPEHVEERTGYERICELRRDGRVALGCDRRWRMDGAPRFFHLLDTRNRIVSQSAVSLAHSFNTQSWAVFTVAYNEIHVSARPPTAPHKSRHSGQADQPDVPVLHLE